MAKKDLQDQQIQWLSELYPIFKFVALAIIKGSMTVAEDAVSNAMQIVLNSIQNGNTAHNKTEFAGYCRTVVRGCSKKTYSTHEGDVKADPAVHNASWVMRPDRHQTEVPKGDFDEDYDPYTRNETIESEDDHE